MGDLGDVQQRIYKAVRSAGPAAAVNAAIARPEARSAAGKTVRRRQHNAQLVEMGRTCRRRRSFGGGRNHDGGWPPKQKQHGGGGSNVAALGYWRGNAHPPLAPTFRRAGGGATKKTRQESHN